MNIFEQQAHNRRMTMGIIVLFVGLFLFLGLGFDFFYGSFNPMRPAALRYNEDSGLYETTRPSQASNIPFGTIISLLIGMGMAMNSMVNGPSMVLRSCMARRAVSAEEKERQLMNIVAEMSTASGLPAPSVYVVPDQDLNAFATGISPSNSVIAVTQGLLDSLNREELQAVVAHEMSHIRNYDMRLMTVLAGLIGAVALISDFAGRMFRYGGRSSSSSGSSSSGSRKGGGGPLILVLFALWVVLIIVAPLLSRMLAMAVSRQREYLADASAAELTRNPKGLISALEKIRAAVMPTNAINNGVAHMCITDPRGSLIEEKMGLTADLLATHPPMEKRILALKAMAYQAEHPQPIS